MIDRVMMPISTVDGSRPATPSSVMSGSVPAVTTPPTPTERLTPLARSLRLYLDHLAVERGLAPN
jgi:hypothetical protein